MQRFNPSGTKSCHFFHETLKPVVKKPLPLVCRKPINRGNASAWIFFQCLSASLMSAGFVGDIPAIP
jgi:hypothetical protein